MRPLTPGVSNRPPSTTFTTTTTTTTTTGVSGATTTTQPTLPATTLADRDAPIAALPTTLSDQVQAVKQGNEVGERELAAAIAAGDLDGVQGTLKSAPYLLNQRLQGDATPVHLAVRAGHSAIVAFLLARQQPPVDTNLADAQGTAPLHEAARLGRTDTASALLQGQADVDARDATGATPFYLAIANGHLDMAWLLLGRGAKIDAPLDDGETPLLVACRKGQRAAVMWLLQQPEIRLRGSRRLDEPYPLNELDAGGSSAFHVALAYGHEDLAFALLRNGAHAHGPNLAGQTPLQIAAAAGLEGMVEHLLAQTGIQPHRADRKGDTPLHKACAGGHEGTVKLLLQNDAPLNIQNTSSATPFFKAVKNKHLGVARLLHAAGANVTTSDKHGLTPLESACSHGTPDMAAWLLSLQPTVEALRVGRYGMTPMHRAAAHQEQPKIMEAFWTTLPPPVFEKLAAVPDDWGVLPYFLAVESGQSDEVLKRLQVAQVGQVSPIPLEPASYKRCWFVIGHDFLSWRVARMDALGKAAGIEMQSYGDGIDSLSWKGLNAQDFRPGDLVICMFHSTWSAAWRRLMVRLGPNESAPMVEVARLLLRKGVSRALFLGCEAAMGTIPLQRCFQHELDTRLSPQARDSRKDLDYTVVGSEKATLVAQNMDAARWWLQDCALRLQHGVLGNNLSRRSVDPVYSLSGSSADAKLSLSSRPLLEASQLHALNQEEAAAARVGLLLMYATDDDLDQVKQLLAVHGVPLNSQSSLGETALYLAAAVNRIRTAKHLLSIDGIDIQRPTEWNYSPLHIACRQGHTEMVQLLLDHGADIHAKEFRGKTPLFIAAENNLPDMLQQLLACGAKLDAANFKGETPLHAACTMGHTKIVEILLEAGADPRAESHLEETPFDSARKHEAVRQLLLKMAQSLKS